MKIMSGKSHIFKIFSALLVGLLTLGPNFSFGGVRLGQPEQDDIAPPPGSGTSLQEAREQRLAVPRDQTVSDRDNLNNGTGQSNPIPESIQGIGNLYSNGGASVGETEVQTAFPRGGDDSNGKGNESQSPMIVGVLDLSNAEDVAKLGGEEMAKEVVSQADKTSIKDPNSSKVVVGVMKEVSADGKATLKIVQAHHVSAKGDLVMKSSLNSSVAVAKEVLFKSAGAGSDVVSNGRAFSILGTRGKYSDMALAGRYETLRAQGNPDMKLNQGEGENSQVRFEGSARRIEMGAQVGWAVGMSKAQVSGVTANSPPAGLRPAGQVAGGQNRGLTDQRPIRSAQARRDDNRSPAVQEVKRLFGQHMNYVPNVRGTNMENTLKTAIGKNNFTFDSKGNVWLGPGTYSIPVSNAAGVFIKRTTVTLKEGGIMVRDPNSGKFIGFVVRNSDINDRKSNLGRIPTVAGNARMLEASAMGGGENQWRVLTVAQAGFVRNSPVVALGVQNFSEASLDGQNIVQMARGPFDQVDQRLVQQRMAIPQMVRSGLPIIPGMPQMPANPPPFPEAQVQAANPQVANAPAVQGNGEPFQALQVQPEAAGRPAGNQPDADKANPQLASNAILLPILPIVAEHAAKNPGQPLGAIDPAKLPKDHVVTKILTAPNSKMENPIPYQVNNERGLLLRVTVDPNQPQITQALKALNIDENKVKESRAVSLFLSPGQPVKALPLLVRELQRPPQ